METAFEVAPQQAEAGHKAPRAAWRPQLVRRAEPGPLSGSADMAGHIARMRQLRRAEAKAKARRREAARLRAARVQWLRSLGKAYVPPEGVAELLVWGLGIAE